MKQRLILFMLLISSFMMHAQQDHIIRLSGMVLEYDSIKPVPYANIQINHTRFGAIADQNGLFSLDVHELDTLVVTEVGMKKAFYVVPDTLTEDSYTIILRMVKDTVSLKTVEVTSWPSLEQFNYAFTEKKGFDMEYKVASRNASPLLDQIDYTKEIEMENYMELNGRRFHNVYLNASIPVGDVLNPKRWDNLVKYWQTGQHR